MVGVESIWSRLVAVYALSVYLPASQAARRLRALSRAVRGKPAPAPTRLPQADFTEVLPSGPARLADALRQPGNVNLSELAMLATAATGVPPGSEIVEIGTFDGRSTLNLAINAPGAAVVTLDLPPDHATAFAVAQGERQYIDKPASGARFRSCRPLWQRDAGRIVQVYGDSARYDWTPHYGRAGLVFVDGSHAYDYARKDSETAFQLVRSRGLVIWHDYGVWPGVTQALEELEAERGLGLIHVRGTSLVVWRAPEVANYVADAPAGQDYEDELSLVPADTPGDGQPASIGSADTARRNRT